MLVIDHSERPSKRQKNNLRHGDSLEDTSSSPTSRTCERSVSDISISHSASKFREDDTCDSFVPIHDSPCRTRQEQLENIEPIDTSVELCFGALCDVACRLIPSGGWHVGQQLRALHRAAEPKPLRLKFSDKFCIISDDNELTIGYMNGKTASDLGSLQVLDQLRLEAFIDRSRLEALISQYESGTNTVRFGVDVNIFGPRSVAESVANDLSRRRLYLQRPEPPPTGIEYRNPQYLDCVGTKAWADDTSLAPILVSDPSLCATIEPVGFADRIWGLMDSLSRPYHLHRRAIVDPEVITTELMDHQKDVIDFVMARERERSDGSEASGTLWEEEVADDGSRFFRHSITGHKNPVPLDAMGGLLADDMGLGKTLSMIASIAASLTDARKYALSVKSTEVDSLLTPTPATLVVVPSALIIDGWIEELHKHVAPAKIKWHRYHGLNRTLNMTNMSSYDLVLTTYSTVAADSSRGRKLLDHIKWFRIILDEAHAIRNWSTKQFKAIHNLSARNRWCMTGTPIQNSLEDLGALVRFTRLPFLEDPSSFSRHITNGIKVTGQPTKASFDNLARLLRSICMRRTNDLLQLPGVCYEDCRPVFTQGERKQYNQLVRDCSDALEPSFYHDPAGKATSGILERLLKLRMYCNQGAKWIDGISGPHRSRDEQLSLLLQNGDAICAICQCDVLTLHEELTRPSGQSIGPYITHCHRITCAECVSSHNPTSDPQGANDKARRCTFCNEIHCRSYAFSTHMGAARTSDRLTPSKLVALLNNIQADMTSAKCLVFTFWQKSISCIEELLVERGIGFAKLDGSVPRAQRKKALDNFRNDEKTTVLLSTFGTGSTGLNNLSMASTVHILEPQWNPSIESQAVGRIFRHGQKNQVRVVRYITRNTIEEAVEGRQLRKLQIAHSSGLSTESGDSRNGRSSKAKGIHVALREYLAKYMASRDFEDTR